MGGSFALTSSYELNQKCVLFGLSQQCIRVNVGPHKVAFMWGTYVSGTRC